ncbi:MAG: hypothetical protein KGZ83_16550 [Sulfuricella sp.]|nr:hypothetical protein [Sulfuricella sp.]
MTESLSCWRCGAPLGEMLLPLARREECPACHADLHVCRMCRFYAPSVAKACREPVADEVNDKLRANFCGYFQPSAKAWQALPGSQQGSARAGLDALFGGNPAEPPAPADNPRAKLDELFK